MFAWLRPSDALDRPQVDHGLRMLIYDGVCSQVMGVLTGGAFLIAFALLLGASNAVIGLIAAVGPLTQLLQVPAIFLVDRTRLRKALVVFSVSIGRLAWVVVAVLPWIVPADQRVSVLIVCLLVYFGFGSIAGCAFNSWMRDLVPQEIMGQYFGKRAAIATAVGAGLSLAAGFAVEAGSSLFEDKATVYTILFMVGTAAGLLGAWFLSRVPEPRMVVMPSGSIVATLTEPFRVENFRRLLLFLASWNFAVNLAAPFFVVYMIKRLGLGMGLVIGLSVVSQLANVLFLRVWGRLADRLTNKSVLTVASPLFILSIFLWPFLTLPERHVLTMPLLVVIHVLAGISTAGVSLAGGNIALKAAPQGKATTFLATNALVCGLAACIAPILAGFAADGFAGENLRLSLEWFTTAAAEPRFSVSALDLRGLDFLFIISGVLGLYATHRLLGVREEGEVEEAVVVTRLYAEVRKAVRHVSNVAGLRQLTYFSATWLRQPKREDDASDGVDGSL